MSKLYFLLITFCVLIFSHVTFAACDATADQGAVEFLADCASSSSNSVAVVSGTGKSGIKDLVIRVSERVIVFGALFAIGFIVYAGIRYTTSIGDDEKIKGAKNTLMYAVIGLILLLIAFPLVDIIVGFVYGLGTT